MLYLLKTGSDFENMAVAYVALLVPAFCWRLLRVDPTTAGPAIINTTANVRAVKGLRKNAWHTYTLLVDLWPNKSISQAFWPWSWSVPGNESALGASQGIRPSDDRPMPQLVQYDGCDSG